MRKKNNFILSYIDNSLFESRILLDLYHHQSINHRLLDTLYIIAVSIFI